jgi:hypothetical protein
LEGVGAAVDGRVHSEVPFTPMVTVMTMIIMIMTLMMREAK